MMDQQNVIAVLIGAITFILIFFYWKYAWERRKMPPGPFPLPIVGNFLKIQRDGLIPSLTKMARTYGPIYTVYFGTRPIVVLTGYQIIKEALVDMGDAFLNRGAIPFVESIMNHAGQPFDPSTTVICASSNIISRLVMGMRFDYSDKRWMDTLAESRKAFHIVSSTWGQVYDTFPRIMKYLPGPHRKTFQLVKSLKDYVKESIKTHQKTLDSACPRDYIDCFLIRMNQDKKNLNTAFHLTNLIETVFDMFLGGSETTAITIYFSLLILIKYPEIQDKIHEEIDQVIGQERAPKADDRNNMPYTNALLHEMQRISDTFPVGLMRSTTRDVTFHGYHIPKGTNVMPMLTTVLNDPSLFETPEKFNIKHFLDEKGKFKKNNGFMPFSAGKRACIAESLVRLQLFIFITVILQKFTLKSVVDPNDLDISPTETGIENHPPTHKIKFIARC
ncbi:cytochrome P450 2C23-like isoform X2 [Ranitomeya imitator]|uniref:cytochrome P450 2C23-like isoform X2 n=1 Tax=Ranitomeya imitator TaxID=111125 RepID=UPI0037E8B888